jgi:hypothetical protein
MTDIWIDARTDVDKTVVCHSGSGRDIGGHTLKSGGYGLPARYRLHFFHLKALLVMDHDERNMNLCSHTSLKGFPSIALKMPMRHAKPQADSGNAA